MDSSASPTLSEREAVRVFLRRLKEHRLARNWSQTEIAARAGLTRTGYQNLELGLSKPTLLTVVRILGVLGYLDRLAELVPPAEVPRTLESLSKPSRMRAWRARSNLSTPKSSTQSRENSGSGQMIG
jgi:transcriptional regulator with XRE-family HTH domain